MLTLAEAQQLLSQAGLASTLVGDPATPINRVHTDTRTLQPGDLFVALRGERFDGHDHLSAARQAGAAAALAEQGIEAAGLPGLQVDDALAALQQLAAGWRARLRLPLIAVVGSNGKTTVTQMVGSILNAYNPGRVLVTAGNLNNHIGVPLTLLRLRPEHQAAVLELGMNHPGEIALLARLVAPTVVLVNNAQREHLEFMHSVEAVASENGAAITALPADGVAVLPVTDAQAPLWREMAGSRETLWFGSSCTDDPDRLVASEAAVFGWGQWQADALQWNLSLRSPVGSETITLSLPGRHNLHNAVAAAAASVALGVPIDAVQRGLQAFRAVAGRSQTSTLGMQGRMLTLVDDSYNANPDSVLAAIDLLADMDTPRWLLLGDMGEVGSDGPRFHAEAGAAAREAGIEHLWAVGAASEQVGADRHFGTLADCLSALQSDADLPDCASVLVKGSRFMQMEQVVGALKARASTSAQTPAQTPQGAAHAA
ncbi:MAG: UDP-N-acetylmuramoyl-tripeptide--D-alanyl-D-alanine ligase [Rubrivivax sp.]